MDDTPGAIASAQRIHRFFVVTSGGLLALVLIGFSPSFFLKPFFEDPGLVVRTAHGLRGGDGTGLGTPDLPLYAVAHGVLATSWMSLFFVQTLLIASGRRTVHQTLGFAGLFLAVGVVASGVTAVLLGIPRLIILANPGDPSSLIAEHVPFGAGDVGSFISFGLAVGVAAHFRRRPDTHKQLMLLASLILVPPALARMWMWSGLENAMEFWMPMSENTLAVLVIGGAWVARRRTPWVLIGAFIGWIVLYFGMVGLGSTDMVQAWVLDRIA